MKSNFNWTCDECAGTSSADWVVLTGKQLRKALDYNENYAAATPSNPRSYTLDELMDAEESLGTWTTLCAKHSDAFPDSGGYHFETSRIMTDAQALDWTLHLLEKNWIQATDWASFLRGKMIKDLDA